jgi:ABC-type sugar transport system substrate-binding protein
MTLSHGVPRYVRTGLVAVLAALLCVAMLLSFAACGTPASSASNATGKTTVGFVGVGSSESPAQEASEKQTVDGLRSAGLSVKYTPATSLDPQAQINAVTELLHSGVSLIVLAAQFTNLWNDTLVMVRNAGIPVVLLDRMPVSLKSYLYSTYVGPSYHSVGTKLAQWVLAQLAKSATSDAASDASSTVSGVLAVESPLDSSLSSDVTFGWSQTMRKAGQDSLTKPATLVGGWDADTTQEIVAKKLDALTAVPSIIVAYNPQAAAGVLAELKARGIPTVRTPTKGSVCVLVAGSAQGFEAAHMGTKTTSPNNSVAFSVRWNADYSKPLTAAITSILKGNSIAKSVAVALTSTTQTSTAAREKDTHK